MYVEYLFVCFLISHYLMQALPYASYQWLSAWYCIVHSIVIAIYIRTICSVV